MQTARAVIGSGRPVKRKRGDYMSIRYKFDVLAALRAVGYTSYRIRREKLLAESTLQKFREGKPVSTDNIGTLCKMLGCQPGDILEYRKEEDSNDTK